MIGYVLKMYPRFSETFILAEILELERLGEKLQLISLKKPDDGRFHEDLARVRAGVSYLPERVPGHPLVFLRAHWRAVSRQFRAYMDALLLALRFAPCSWKGFLRAPLVAEVARESGCARLHAHFASVPATTAMFAARLAGVPFTFTAHAKDIYQRSNSRRLLRALMFQAERVVTVSEFNRRYLTDLAGPGLPAGRIVRIYNGVDLDRFRPAAPAEAPRLPLLLAIGRLEEKKGFADLVEACGILRDRGVPFLCEIVGKGSLHDDLAGRIAANDLGDRVTLAGPLPRGELMRRLPEAAVVAVPCLVGQDGNRDGLPTVILEAMASGVPVVTTRVTGIPEAVEDGGTGRVLEPGRPDALAAALAELLANPDLRRSMGAAGRRRARELFDQRRNVATLARTLADAGRSEESSGART